MDDPISISAEQARRFAMWRHQLGRRSLAPLAAVQAQIAVQTQYAMSLPVSVALRARRHRPELLVRSIQPGGPLIKCWSIRNTLHTMFEADFELLRHAFSEWYRLRFLRWMTRDLGLTESELQGRHDRLLERLASGPKTRAELHEAVPEYKSMAGTGWGIDVMGLAYEGRIAMCSHTGPTTFFLREPLPPPLTQERAQEEAIRRYLRQYGPATVNDARYWAGQPARVIQPTFQRLRGELQSLIVDGKPGYYILRDDLAALLDPPAPPRVALGAKFDTYLLAHADKSWYLDPQHRDRVFRPAGQVEAAVLDRGLVRGTWRMRAVGRTLVVTIEPFPGRWPAALDPGIEREAGRLATGLGYDNAQVVYAKGGLRQAK